MSNKEIRKGNMIIAHYMQYHYTWFPPKYHKSWDLLIEVLQEIYEEDRIIDIVLRPHETLLILPNFGDVIKVNFTPENSRLIIWKTIVNYITTNNS